jgi:hypothetical protein
LGCRPPSRDRIGLMLPAFGAQPARLRAASSCAEPALPRATGSLIACELLATGRSERAAKSEKSSPPA